MRFYKIIQVNQENNTITIEFYENGHSVSGNFNIPLGCDGQPLEGDLLTEIIKRWWPYQVFSKRSETKNIDYSSLPIGVEIPL